MTVFYKRLDFQNRDMYLFLKKDVFDGFFIDDFFQKQFWGKRWYIKVVQPQNT